MARFYDKVGFGNPGELVDGVWSDSITERAYYGDVLNNTQALEVSDKVNPDIRLQQRISIMADAYAVESASKIKYVSWAGSLWMVESFTIERPRLILTLGGVYDGPRPTPPAPATP